MEWRWWNGDSAGNDFGGGDSVGRKDGGKLTCENGDAS